MSEIRCSRTSLTSKVSPPLLSEAWDLLVSEQVAQRIAGIRLTQVGRIGVCFILMGHAPILSCN